MRPTDLHDIWMPTPIQYSIVKRICIFRRRYLGNSPTGTTISNRLGIFEKKLKRNQRIFQTDFAELTSSNSRTKLEPSFREATAFP